MLAAAIAIPMGLIPLSASAQLRAPGAGQTTGSGIRAPAPVPTPVSPQTSDYNRCGCVPWSGAQDDLLRLIGVDDPDFIRAFQAQSQTQAPNPPPGGSCAAFAVAGDRAGKVQAIAVHLVGGDGASGRLLSLSRTRFDGAVLLSSEDMAPLLASASTLTATLAAVQTRAPALVSALPPEVFAELTTVVPLLKAAVPGVDESAYLVRAVFDVGSAERWSRLLGVELIDRISSLVVADTFWVERDDLPSGFLALEGRSVEHHFWTHPLRFNRISRGLGMGRALGRPRAPMRATAAAKPRRGAVPAAAARSPGRPQARPRKGARDIGGPVVLVRRPAAGAGQAARSPDRKASRAGAVAGKATARHARLPGRLMRMHMGVDYAAPTGTSVVAVADGVVSHMGPDGGYGNLVVLTHPGGYTSYYAHLSEFAEELRPGSEVRRGLEIGYVGSTGFSTGPHLHFEIRKANKYLDPLDHGVPEGPWHWRAGDQSYLLRQVLIADAMAAAYPLALAGAPTNSGVVVRRCTDGR
jgi:hypothetical protein